MKKFVQIYGKYFFVLPLVLAIREYYGIIFNKYFGDWFSALMMTGFAIYFYLMSVGKIKKKSRTTKDKVF